MVNLRVQSLSKIKTLFFASIFTALSVLTPLAAHYFGGVAAGRLFLPMHFFVLAAGLVLGWRGGLAVGILTPLISYSASGMPVVAVLPFVLLELAAYGFFAGLLQERIKNVWAALAGALILGRVILFLGIAVLPTKLVASQYVVSAMLNGWRGVALQVLLVPVAVVFVRRFLRDEWV